MFAFPLPLKSRSLQVPHLGDASLQAGGRAPFNSRGAPRQWFPQRWREGAHSAEKASPGISIPDVPGSTRNYTFSTSPSHLPFRGELQWVTLPSPVGAHRLLGRASRSLGWEISISFFIGPAGAVASTERVLAAAGKIIHPGGKKQQPLPF